jgi:hypothetical protein
MAHLSQFFEQHICEPLDGLADFLAEVRTCRAIGDLNAKHLYLGRKAAQLLGQLQDMANADAMRGMVVLSVNAVVRPREARHGPPKAFRLTGIDDQQPLAARQVIEDLNRLRKCENPPTTGTLH